MVDCPPILKRKKNQGISITELLIVITIIAILMVVFMAAFKPWTQQAKARDSRRKSDLQKLKAPLEDYYNDNNCYPLSLGNLVPDYIGEEPKDPDTGDYYEYYRLEDDCDKYWIYTDLEWQQDSEIVEVGCGAGCGPEGDSQTDPDIKCVFNYGVCGGGVSLEGCTTKCDGAFELDQACLDNIPLEVLKSEQVGRPACCGENGPGNGVVACSPTECWCCPVD